MKTLVRKRREARVKDAVRQLVRHRTKFHGYALYYAWWMLHEGTDSLDAEIPLRVKLGKNSFVAIYSHRGKIRITGTKAIVPGIQGVRVS